MKSTRTLAILLSALVIAAWLGVNYTRVVDVEEGFIKLVLALLFGLLLLMRGEGAALPLSWGALAIALSAAAVVIILGAVGGAFAWSVAAGWIGLLVVGVPVTAWICGRLGRARPGALAIAGAALVGLGLLVTGIVFRVRQFEWVGLLCLLYSGLVWALPARFARNVPWMLFFLFWVHPLPWGLYFDFQLFMQEQSVNGSEWLLHVLNARVWADGLALRTGAKDFGVPEACSGMRTATTVLFCVLGAGLLSRFRWYEIVMFLVLAAFQVLALNVARITGMVYISPRMPEGWSDRFLHDTMEIFLLVAVFIIVMEMVLWRRFWYLRWRIRTGRKTGEIERPIAGTRFPVIWHRIFKFSGLAAGLVFAMAAFAFAVYQSRPWHRAQMVRGIIPDLIERNPRAAIKAADRVLSVITSARDMISVRASALARLELFDQAVAEYERLERIEPLNLTETVTKGLCLLQLGRVAEAGVAVRALPPGAEERPGVALILAENAARENDIDGVVRHVRRAATHPLLVPQVRRLFPYLANREQWAAIAEVDADADYADIDQAALAVLAGVRAKNTLHAGRAMQRALVQWPDDPHLLFPLFELARESGLDRWQTQLGELFARHIGTLDLAQLDSLCAYFFNIHRVDLAWMAYRRMADIGETREIELDRMAGFMGETWFQVVRRAIYVPSERADSKIDLRTMAGIGLKIPGFSEFWHRVPLVGPLSERRWREESQRRLDLALAAMSRLVEAEPDDWNLRLAYVDLLAALGRVEEAHAQLDALSGMNAEPVPVLDLRRAFLFHAQQRWVEAFEAVRRYDQSGGSPNVRLWLAQIEAAMNLNWAVYALARMETLRAKFPGIPELLPVEVTFWSTFALYDEALLAIEGREDAIPREALVHLLYAGGRINMAHSMARTHGITLERVSSERERLLNRPVLAEGVFEPVFAPALAPAAKLDAAHQVEALLSGEAESFASRLGRLMVEWYRATAEGRTEPDLEQWVESGRDAMEQGTALYRLAMLLGQDGRLDDANTAVRRAIEVLPESPILWRLKVSLSGGDATTARLAHEACPRDSDLWLANLMARAADLDDETLAEQIRQEASSLAGRTVYALVRAGDWLLRKDYPKAASMVSAEALRRAQGFLPAYALAVRCAVREERWDDVLAAANEAVNLTDDPSVFYQVIVAVSDMRGARDAGLRSALEFLAARFSSETIWGEQLGRFYFLTGDTQRSFNILQPLIRSDMERMTLGSILVGAEMARLEGQAAESIRMLERALPLHPDSLYLINNLAYVLAESAEAGHRERAVALVPKLIATMGDTPVPDVLDTIAFVYTRHGDNEKALSYSDAAFEAAKKLGEVHPFIWLNRAEIFLRAGRRGEAEELLLELQRDRQLAPDIKRRARELMEALSGLARP